MLLSNESAEIAISDISSRLIRDVKSDGLKRSELKSQTGLNAAIFNFLIERLTREQKTATIVATHSLEAASVCDTLVKLRDGRVEEVTRR